MDCSPPGFSVHEILWARILEWLAISFSRGSSRPRDQIWVSYISCLGRQVLYHTSVATQDKDKVWKKCKETDLVSCLDPTSCLPLFSYTFIFPCPFPTLSLIPFLFSRALSPTWWLQFHQPNLNLLLWALLPQSCLTLCDLMDCTPPGSSVREVSPGKNTGVGCHAVLQGIFPIQGSNPHLLHCRWILYQLSHQGSPVFWT